MNKRPLSVTIIAWLYMVTGVVGLAYHATEFDVARPFEGDGLWILLVRLLAVVAGAFMLRGRNWARWLAVLWMAWHVGGPTRLAWVCVHSWLPEWWEPGA